MACRIKQCRCISEPELCPNWDDDILYRSPPEAGALRKLAGAPQEAKVVSIDPMIIIEFSRHGAFAHKHWPTGKTEEIPVEDAMKEFDRLAASDAFER